MRVCDRHQMLDVSTQAPRYKIRFYNNIPNEIIIHDNRIRFMRLIDGITIIILYNTVWALHLRVYGYAYNILNLTTYINIMYRVKMLRD